MSQQISEDARGDFEAMIQFLTPFAEQMLRESGEFYPFAAMITLDGDLVPFEAEMESEMPDPNQVIARITSSFQQAAEKKKIRSAGWCYNGSAVEAGNKLDAIILHVEHIAAGALKGYVTYEKGLFKKYRLGALKMGRGEVKIFLNAGSFGS